MSNHRQIFRGAALADRRAAQPAAVSGSSQYARLNARQAPARAVAPAVEGVPPRAKRACWHGRSDRRYIVTVHALEGAEVPTCGVALAVRRHEGALKLIAAEPFVSTSVTFRSFRSFTRAKGATELHILAMDPGECRGRDAIVRDLLAAN